MPSRSVPDYLRTMIDRFVKTVPLDLDGNSLRNAEHVDTASATVGDRELELGRNEEQTFSVPGDYETIQAALDDLPTFAQGQTLIEVDHGVYEEDLIVPPTIGGGQAGDQPDAELSGPYDNVVIKGDPDQPEACTINSIMISTAMAASAVRVDGFALTDESPYDNESAAFTFYGPGEVRGRNLQIAGEVTRGATIYNGAAKLNGVDVGEELCDIGVYAKRHASIDAESTTGSTTDLGYFASANSNISIRETKIEGDDGLANRSGGSMIWDDLEDRYTGGFTEFDGITSRGRNIRIRGAGEGLVLEDLDGSGDNYRLRIDDGELVTQGPF